MPKRTLKHITRDQSPRHHPYERVPQVSSYEQMPADQDAPGSIPDDEEYDEYDMETSSDASSERSSDLRRAIRAYMAARPHPDITEEFASFMVRRWPHVLLGRARRKPRYDALPGHVIGLIMSFYPARLALLERDPQRPLLHAVGEFIGRFKSDFTRKPVLLFQSVRVSRWLHDDYRARLATNAPSQLRKFRWRLRFIMSKARHMDFESLTGLTFWGRQNILPRPSNLKRLQSLTIRSTDPTAKMYNGRIGAELTLPENAIMEFVFRVFGNKIGPLAEWNGSRRNFSIAPSLVWDASRVTRCNEHLYRHLFERNRHRRIRRLDTSTAMPFLTDDNSIEWLRVKNFGRPSISNDDLSSLLQKCTRLRRLKISHPWGRRISDNALVARSIPTSLTHLTIDLSVGLVLGDLIPRLTSLVVLNARYTSSLDYKDKEARAQYYRMERLADRMRTQGIRVGVEMDAYLETKATLAQFIRMINGLNHRGLLRTFYDLTNVYTQERLEAAGFGTDACAVESVSLTVHDDTPDRLDWHISALVPILKSPRLAAFKLTVRHPMRMRLDGLNKILHDDLDHLEYP